jgi:putative membrane protein
VPGCYREHLEAIRGAYFPDEKNYPETTHGVNWRIAVRMFIIQGILPVGIGMLLSWNWLGSDVWGWLLWLPFAMWLSIKYYRTWFWHVSAEGIRTAWGVVNRHEVLLQWYKVQAVSIRQSIFLKRRGLAHLVLYTAAGAVSVPYVEMEKAKEVHDYVLSKVETDTRNWM